MPVPMPSLDDTKLTPPDAEETRVLAGGVAAAVAPESGLVPVQRLLLEALIEAMTGFVVPVSAIPRLGPEEYARALACRNEQFRSRMVQLMLLCELVLVPLPPEVAASVEHYAAELGVDDSMLRIARRMASGSLGLALFDFQRSGYMETWDPAKSSQLHTSKELSDAWEQCVRDNALAERWRALAGCAEGSLGLAVSRFYAARGFSVPGTSGSAPPLLAQHDWVHVLADYGSTVESEIEVFALIARANDDPRAFSLLAMVVSLFETGYLASGAGLFQYDRGHLSSERGMAVRLADAMRRGALCAAANNSVDLLAVDWFEHADRPLVDVRAELGLVDKSDRAVEEGSVGPWESGGISPYQFENARRVAAERGVEYDSFGASPPEGRPGNPAK